MDETSMSNILSILSDFQHSFSFLILSIGGLIIELLAAKNNQKRIPDLSKHYIKMSRVLAIAIFAIGLILASLHSIIPYIDTMYGEMLFALAVALFASATLYIQGTFEDKRYWLMSAMGESIISPLRDRIVMSVIEEQQQGKTMELEEISKLVRGKVKDKLPFNTLLFKRLSYDAVKEISFCDYHIEKSLKKLVDNKECTLKGKKYILEKEIINKANQKVGE